MHELVEEAQRPCLNEAPEGKIVGFPRSSGVRELYERGAGRGRFPADRAFQIDCGGRFTSPLWACAVRLDCTGEESMMLYVPLCILFLAVMDPFASEARHRVHTATSPRACPEAEAKRPRESCHMFGNVGPFTWLHLRESSVDRSQVHKMSTRGMVTSGLNEGIRHCLRGV
jgi:hypothetical protein